MVKDKLIRIKNNTGHMINECRKDYLKNHPEMVNINITYDKIVYEMAKFYLKW